MVESSVVLIAANQCLNSKSQLDVNLSSDQFSDASQMKQNILLKMSMEKANIRQKAIREQTWASV